MVLQTASLKEMTIGEMVAKYPQTAQIMQGFGLHCIGCHVNPYETIEQGAAGHGMSQEDFNEMIKELEKAVKENPKTSKTSHPVESDAKNVSLTKNAVQKVLEFREKEGKGNEYGLRVSAAPGGCAGFMYRLEFDKATQEDLEIDQGGVKLIVASEQVPMLKGVKIDYVDSLEGSGFKIENPNSKGSCGCGKSFN